MAKMSYPNGLPHSSSDVLLTASLSGFVGMCIGVAALIAASNGLLGLAGIFTNLGPAVSVVTFLSIPAVVFGGVASCVSSVKGFFENRQTRLESRINKELGSEFNVQKFGNELTAENVHTYTLDLKTGKSEVVCIAFKRGIVHEMHIGSGASTYLPGVGFGAAAPNISFTDEPGLESFVDKVLDYSQMTYEQKDIIDRMRRISKAPPESNDRLDVEQKTSSLMHDERPRPSDRAPGIADPLHHANEHPAVSDVAPAAATQQPGTNDKSHQVPRPFRPGMMR